MRRLLRTYFPPLPRSVATLQVGGLVNAFGNGVVYPFLFIYLHNVRGIGLAVAGLILAVHAVTSIVAGPIFGSQIDRFGGKVTLAVALGILSVGYAGYVFVHEPWQGFVVAAVSGIGVGGFWPAQSTLIAGLTPAEQRPAAFAMQRVVISGGIGLGALTGGLIATAESPGSFELLFLLDAVSFLVYMAVMLALVPEPDLRDGTEGAAGRSGSYRQVLAHRAFVAVIGLNALFILAGFSGFDVLPVYAKNEAGISEAQIGLLFLVNTIVIVLAQAPIARLARGHRRMATLAPARDRVGDRLAARAARRSRARERDVPVDRDHGLLRARAVPARGGRGAARRRPRPTSAPRPLHGAERALVAGRLRARACDRRVRALDLSRRRLGGLRGVVPRRHRARLRDRERAPGRCPPDARARAGLGLMR